VWHWLLEAGSGGAVSESGRLRHGEGIRGPGARRRRVLELATLGGIDARVN